MKCYKPILIVFACLSLRFPVSAQTHDKDGYYIDLKGDTVSGKFLNYREPAHSPSILSFQAAGSSTPIDLSPAQCKKISIDQSDNYISYQGKRLTNSTSYENAPSDAADVFEDISAFLRELYSDGHYHLYEFADARRSNFYISGDGTSLQELSYKEFMNNGNVVQWPGFRLQLQTLFQTILQQNPERERLIDHVAYTGPALTDLFSKMTTGKAVALKRKYPAKIFVGFGASANSLKITGDETNPYTFNSAYAALGKYSPQTSPLFEAGIKLFSQRNDGRLFLTIRAEYYWFQNSFAFQASYVADPVVYHSLTTFKSDVFSLPLGIGYSLVKRKHFNFDVSAGIAVVILSGNTETQTTNSVLTFYGPASDNKSNAFSFFGEAEFVLFNRFSFFGGYNSPIAVTNVDLYDPTHTSLKFGARFYIF